MFPKMASFLPRPLAGEKIVARSLRNFGLVKPPAARTPVLLAWPEFEKFAIYIPPGASLAEQDMAFVPGKFVQTSITTRTAVV